MRVLPGKVLNGHVVITADGGAPLRDGSDVKIVTTDDDRWDIDDPELEAELLASIAEADAGDVISLDELLRDLRSRD